MSCHILLSALASKYQLSQLVRRFADNEFCVHLHYDQDGWSTIDDVGGIIKHLKSQYFTVAQRVHEKYFSTACARSRYGVRTQ